MFIEKPVTGRYHGTQHGPITRLIDPTALGKYLKPFIFLDFFNAPVQRGFGFGMHPHSGIATLTWQPGCDVRYEDTTGQQGVLRAGGLEWMNSGGGAWHQGRFDTDGQATGFQLWVAMPPGIEDGDAFGQYVPPDEVESVIFPGGEVRVLLGQCALNDASVGSAIKPHQDMNYFVLHLHPNAAWQWQVPSQHDVCWAFPFKGSLVMDGRTESLELMTFGAGEGIWLKAGSQGATVMLGSGRKHPHPLVMGTSSVHTNETSLKQGLQRIRAMGQQLRLQGRLT